jgi:hypothetical protein
MDKKEFYEKQKRKYKNLKFKTLYDTIPFLKDLDKQERFKQIKKYKLITAWEQNGGEHYDNYGWFRLGVIEQELEKNEVDWQHIKLEDIKFPDVVVCDFSDEEGCQDCKNRFKCEMGC